MIPGGWIFSSLSWMLLASATSPAQQSAPLLRLNTEMHTARIWRLSSDAQGKIILTCSNDKTVKLWDASDGSLILTIRPPFDAEKEGMLFSCALTPDGKILAVGGRTGPMGNSKIYLFNATTGEMIQYLAGLESAAMDLKFSPDGRYLAAALPKKIGGGGHGVRIYKWEENQKKFDSLLKLGGYHDVTHGICFDQSGRFATVCYDGFLRLYDDRFSKINEVKTLGGKNPYGISFSPDGSRIAVGYEDSPTVEVYDGRTLELLFRPDITGTEINDSLGQRNYISKITFSADGQYLFGGGMYHIGDRNNVMWMRIRRWNDGGKGNYTDFNVSQNTISDIISLPDNSIVFCGGDPDFGRMKSDGQSIFYKTAEINAYNESDKTSLKINREGDEVGFKPSHKNALFFSLKNRQLTKDQTDIQNFRHYTDHLGCIAMTDYHFNRFPKLNGDSLNVLETYEYAYSTDISPDTSSIVIGALWNIYCLDTKGIRIWKTQTQGIAYAVTVSGDNRFVITTLSDGTIRWYRMSDGALLLTLFAHPDNTRWVLYTANGYFISSMGGDELIGWHINNGPDKAASFYPAKNYSDLFFRPDIISEVLAKCQTDEEVLKRKNEQKTDISKKPPLVRITSPANNSVSDKGQVTVIVDVTDQGGGIEQVMLYVNGKLVETAGRGIVPVTEPVSTNARTFTITLTGGINRIKATAFNDSRTESTPDEIGITFNGPKAAPNLYLLLIGINEYKNPSYRLNYAVADATGFRSELEKGTKNIFGKVETIFLQDATVTRKSILEKFSNLQSNIRQEDVFIFYYAGHGVMSEGQNPQFYIVPYDVTQMIQTSLEMQNIAVSAGELQSFSKDLRAQKQLFIFDACQSGGLVDAFAMRGTMEERAIAQLARSTGTYWIAASGSQQFATEFAKLGHGLFTYTILQGLKGGADGNNDKKITVEELLSYVKNKLPEFSEQYKGVAQYPNSFGYGMDFPLSLLK